jgi:hypothetical protein
MTDEPEPGGTPSRGPANGTARDIVLILLTAAGVLVIMLGVFALARGSGDRPLPSDVAGSGRPASPATRSPTLGPSPSGTAASATPQVSVPGDPVLVGAGDIAMCDGSDDEATAAILDGIAGTVFTAGDNAYDSGTPDEFARCYEPSWGRHKARTRPAPGNHDHETEELAGYLGYFGPEAGTAREPWYSYDLGAWHIVVLDSTCEKVRGGCGPDSPQVTWLVDDLARHDNRCTLAIWHHPRFSSGVHGSDPAVDAFWQALHAAGADLIVNGHDHSYERFAPQTPAGEPDPAAGIREFVVGTGGARLRGFPDSVANSELRADISHGVIAFTLRPTSYEWVFIPTESSFEDRGITNCH